MLISLIQNSCMKCLGEPFVRFSVRLLVFFLLSLESSLYSEYHPLMKIHCENISCHSLLCLFHSFNSIFHRARIFNFGEIVYFLWIVISLSWQKSLCLTIGPEDFLFFKKIHSFIFQTWKYGPFWDSLKFLYKMWGLGQVSATCLWTYPVVPKSFASIISPSNCHCTYAKESDFPTFPTSPLGITQ